MLAPNSAPEQKLAPKFMKDGGSLKKKMSK